MLRRNGQQSRGQGNHSGGSHKFRSWRYRLQQRHDVQTSGLIFDHCANALGRYAYQSDAPKASAPVNSERLLTSL
jgi:hypothetical protein